MPNNHDYLDPVRAYCVQRGFADYVIDGGLEGMVERWAAAVGFITAAEHRDIYELLNDIDGRQLIHDSLVVAPADEVAKLAHQLEMADREYFKTSIPLITCLWGDQRAKEQGWSPDVNWWYFRKPHCLDPDD